MKDSVVQMGALVLRDIAKPVAKQEFGTKELAATVKKMQKLVAAEEFGVAIAAPQSLRPHPSTRQNCYC